MAAVENMLPDGKHKRHFYLSIDFVRNPNLMTPKQEVYQQAVLDAYPGVAELSLRGSVNPNLMPKDSITVRMHSVGGWGAITTGKNLAMTLFELDQLKKMVESGKHVVLVAGPCLQCGRSKSEALRPLVKQPSLHVFNHLVTDIGTANELLAWRETEPS